LFPPMDIGVARLSGLTRLSPDAQHIVANLKRSAERPPGPAQSLSEIRVTARRQRAKAQRGIEERSRLLLDHPHVGAQLDVRFLLETDVQCLARHHFERRLIENTSRLEHGRRRLPL